MLTATPTTLPTTEFAVSGRRAKSPALSGLVLPTKHRQDVGQVQEAGPAVSEATEYES